MYFTFIFHFYVALSLEPSQVADFGHLPGRAHSVPAGSDAFVCFQVRDGKWAAPQWCDFRTNLMSWALCPFVCFFQVAVVNAARTLLGDQTTTVIVLEFLK